MGRMARVGPGWAGPVRPAKAARDDRDQARGGGGGGKGEREREGEGEGEGKGEEREKWRELEGGRDTHTERQR